MATQYDSEVIQKFTDRLYLQARTIAVLYALLGAVMGVVFAFVYASAARGSVGASELGVFCGIPGLVGVALGRSRAFALRLPAQMALCQAEIERSTRSPGR